MKQSTERAWILSPQPVKNWSDFVQFWETMYNYSSNSNAYDELVLNRPPSFIFELEHLQKLFEWKNNTGETLAAKKATSVTKIMNNLPIVRQLAENWHDAVFNEHFGEISAIWQTFLMHIIQPDRFPIFDQHVHRAHAYLQQGEMSELKGTTKQKLNQYVVYKSFFEEVRQESGCHPRHLDRAFWAFGKFIKQYKSI